MVGLNISTVCIICNVIQAQDHAIVDITQSNPSLVKFPGIDVVACGAQHNPICIKLNLTSS